MDFEVKTLKYIDYYRDFEQVAINRIKESFSWFDESNNAHLYHMRGVVGRFCLGDCFENYDGVYTPLYFSDLEQDLASWSKTSFYDKFGNTIFTFEQVVAVFKEVLIPLFKEAGFEDTVTFWGFW